MLYYQLEGPKPKFSLFDASLHRLDTNKKIINIICYCLMPNHFHFLLQQVRMNGITEFISKLTNSYTKYFNTKNQRVGPLFQGEFKAVLIQDDAQLLHLSRYIHLNPLVEYVVKDLKNYPWSSYTEYINPNSPSAPICTKEIILNQFASLKNYQKFVLDQEDYAKKLEFTKHQLFDAPQV